LNVFFSSGEAGKKKKREEKEGKPRALFRSLTDRIFSPYGSESTSASTGIFSSSRSFLRNSLDATSGCPFAVMMMQGYCA